MASRVLATTFLISAAAATALWGSANAQTNANSTNANTLDCKDKSKDNPCDVSIVHYFPWVRLSLPEFIVVDAPPGQAVTIKWTMTSWLFTHFNEAAGIVFDKPEGKSNAVPQTSKCEAVSGDTYIYKCELTGLVKDQLYHYTIKTKGLFSPRDQDPYIRNGN